MLDPKFQPGWESLLQRLGNEISARAILLIHESGQILQRFGSMDENDYPAMAALLAAMIATGKSIRQFGDTHSGSSLRFSCDSDTTGLYTVAVHNDLWLAAFFQNPINPGQVRMRVRTYAQTLARFGIPGAQSSGAKLPPGSFFPSQNLEKITVRDPSLFSNITDDEIDRLFEEAQP